MNERIIKLALEAGLLNYVDNETPRHYFVHADIEMEDIEKFARLMISECAYALVDNELYSRHVGHALREHFEVE